MYTAFQDIIYSGIHRFQELHGCWKAFSFDVGLKQGHHYEGLFIESWSASAGYSAEMLTEDGKSWRVEDESTLASSVNIEAEYPALADHEEIA